MIRFDAQVVWNDIEFFVHARFEEMSSCMDLLTMFEGMDSVEYVSCNVVTLL